MSISYIVCEVCLKVMTRITTLVETDDYIKDEDILVEDFEDDNQDHDWENSDCKFWDTCDNCEKENDQDCNTEN